MQLNPYSADAPVKDSEQDEFSRWPFAQRIARVIASRQDPSSIVIGINGAWGEGKTTVLNFIAEELKQYPHVECTYFNPWRFPDESKLLINFFEVLAGAVDRATSTNVEKIGQAVIPYVSKLAAFFDKGSAVEAIGKLFSAELEEVRQRVVNILREQGKRVVILMDDIDRLDKAEIQMVFRLIKLSADFDYVAYVLAFDDEMVAAALQEKFGSKNLDAGHSFLEKIIQVPLAMPAIESSSLVQFCLANVERALQEAEIKLSQKEERVFARHFINGLAIRVRTPRMAKRYGNIIAFSLPILKGEVNPVDLMLIEGIRVFYPKLYNLIRRRPDIFLGQILNSFQIDEPQNYVIQLLEEGLEGLRLEEKLAVKELLSVLFPRLNLGLGNIRYASDWDIKWAEEQRVASPAYFPRYFSYAVPDGDISDQELISFVSQLDSKTVEYVSNELTKFINTRSEHSLITKLNAQITKISPGASLKLAKAITLISEQLPRSQAVLSFTGIFSKFAMLISSLIQNVPDEVERINFATSLLQDTEPLIFAIEIHRWIREEDEKVGLQQLSFSPEQYRELGQVLANRVSHLATNQMSIFEQYPEDCIILLTTWAEWGSQTDVSQYLENLLKADATNALLLLEQLLPTYYSLENEHFKGNFERDQYDVLTRFVTPEIVYEALKALYGDSLDVEDFPKESSTSLKDRAARQFAWIHRYVMEST